MAVAAAANALCSVADVKYVWGRGQADTAHDDRIQTLINKISGRVEAWCGRSFKEATYTDEAYDGDGDSILPLKNYPISAVAALSIDGIAVDVEDETTFRVYEEEGFVWYSAGFRAAYPLGVKVTYTAGYSAVPEGLQSAVIEWVIILLEGRMKDAKVKAEDMRLAMPDQIESALAPYKRMDG